MCNFKRSQGRFWIFGVVFLLGSVANHGFADSETAEPVTQSENTTSISSGAIVGKQMDIPAIEGYAMSREGAFPIEMASEELRSFVGIQENIPISGLSPLDNQLGDEIFIADRDKYVSGSYKLVFTQDGYLDKVLIVLRNISGKDLQLRQQLVPKPAIYFISPYMHEGLQGIEDVFRKANPSNRDRIFLRSTFPANAHRIWVFEAKDLLIRRESLVSGVVSKMAIYVNFGIVDREFDKSVVVSYEKKIQQVPLRLPVAFEEFHEFDKEAFYQRNFSGLEEKVKQLPPRRKNSGLPR